VIGRKAVARALQRFAQLDVVVDLPVEDDGDRPILIENRLLAGLHVDDGEPAHSERNIRSFPIARGVGAAMMQTLRHQFQRCSIVWPGEASYAAHCDSVADAEE
jgi:hypothetical protein